MFKSNHVTLKVAVYQFRSLTFATIILNLIAKSLPMPAGAKIPLLIGISSVTQFSLVPFGKGLTKFWFVNLSYKYDLPSRTTFSSLAQLGQAITSKCQLQLSKKYVCLFAWFHLATHQYISTPYCASFTLRETNRSEGHLAPIEACWYATLPG